jgi:hypothetical protein
MSFLWRSEKDEYTFTLKLLCVPLLLEGVRPREIASPKQWLFILKTKSNIGIGGNADSLDVKRDGTLKHSLMRSGLIT